MMLVSKLFRLHFTGLVLLLFINACKDPDNVGLDVLPTSDLAALSTTDTVSLLTSTVREDSLSTTGLPGPNLLGAISDNQFGYTNSSFYAQLLLSTANVTFGTNPVVDSVVLGLDYAGYYGDTLSTTHEITVYELGESILTDSIYYSNKTFATIGTLGTLTTTDIRPTDSVTLGTVKTSPHLRINLDLALGNRFITAASSNYASNDAFTSFFKGIYIRDNVTSGTGCILYFGAGKARTKLSLYYHNDTDTIEYGFSLNGTRRVNHFEHDYATAVFGNNFNDPVFGSNQCYIQSMASVKTKVEIPYLTNLTANQNIAINKAELIIPAESTPPTLYPRNNSLFLVGIDSVGKSFFLPDYIDLVSSFGGTYASGNYTFIITRYVQQILTGARKNYGLYIVSSSGSVNAYRTVIGGSNNATSPMKLRLTYTSLNN